MSNAKVLIVEHQGNGGPGLLGQTLKRRGVEVTVVGPDTGQPLPESLEGYEGLVVLGGSMGPTDDDKAPWLPQARQLLLDGVERDIPTLGICLGAQLLVTASGGVVDTMSNGPEIGLHHVNVDAPEDDPLFGALPATVPVVQWHWLEAAKLPENVEVFASNDHCPNQAFKVAPRAWGVQFHPEVLMESLASWAEDDRKSLDELRLDATEVVSKVAEKRDELDSVWGGFANRFADLVIGE